MFNIKIHTDGAAFRDPERTDDCGEAVLDPQGNEVRRILRSISEQLEKGYDAGNIMDSNGNSVGFWKYE